MIETNLGNIKIWNDLEYHRSKSGALLSVILQLDKVRFKDFYKDNAGFRIYMLDEIPRNGIGANEFHKNRKEIAIVNEGDVEWIIEDLNGDKKNFILKSGDIMFYIPPLTLHTYIGKSKKSSMIIVSNTIYYKNKIQTHDTYTKEEFIKLQEKMSKRFK